MTSVEQTDARSGRASFEAFVRIRSDELVGMACLVTRNWADAQDAVQDALVALYPRWQALPTQRDLDRYVNRAVINSSLKTLRRRRRIVPVTWRVSIMNDQLYEKALTEAFTHVTSQPRPASVRLVSDVVIARTASAKPVRQVRGRYWIAAAVAASILVLSGVLWMVSRPVPPIAGMPGPQPTTPVATGEASVKMSFDVDESLPYASTQIDVHRDGNTMTIGVTTAKDGEAAKKLGAFNSPSGILWSIKVDEDLQVALIPGYAANVASLSEGTTIRSEYLRAVDVTAVAIEHTDSTSQDLVWLGNDDLVRDSRGRIVPSGTLTAADHTVVMFEDPHLSAWGYFDDLSGTWVALPLDTEPSRMLRPLAAISAGEYLEEATWITVLPTGSTDPELNVQEGVSWDSAAIGDTGRIAILVYADRVKAGHTGVLSITYTDSRGQSHTYKP